jgi:hypothetical protein
VGFDRGVTGEWYGWAMDGPGRSYGELLKRNAGKFRRKSVHEEGKEGSFGPRIRRQIRGAKEREA